MLLCRGDGDKAGDRLGEGNEDHPGPPRVGPVGQQDSDLDRFVARHRRLNRGLNRQRGDDGRQFIQEQVSQVDLLCFTQLVRGHAPDPGRSQGGFDLVQEAGVELVEHQAGSLPDGVQLLPGSHAGRVGCRDLLLLEYLQAPDTDHEKLVQVRCRDGRELDSLQEG